MRGQSTQVTATFHCIGFLSRVLVLKAKLRKLKSVWSGRQRRLSASLHLKVAWACCQHSGEIWCSHWRENRGGKKWEAGFGKAFRFTWPLNCLKRNSCLFQRRYKHSGKNEMTLSGLQVQHSKMQRDSIICFRLLHKAIFPYCWVIQLAVYFDQLTLSTWVSRHLSFWYLLRCTFLYSWWNMRAVLSSIFFWSLAWGHSREFVYKNRLVAAANCSSRQDGDPFALWLVLQCVLVCYQCQSGVLN